MEEKIQSSDINFLIDRLSESDRLLLSSFDCGVEALNEFCRRDVFSCAKYRYVSAYCAYIPTDSSKVIIAVFTLSNDVISLTYNDKEDFIDSVIIDSEYQDTFNNQAFFPAVNIAHLAVDKRYQSHNVGSEIVDFIIATFRNYQTTGCQFITVDSLNNPKTNKFYMKKGFCNLTDSDMNKETRRMFLQI